MTFYERMVKRWGKYIAGRIVRYRRHKTVSPCPGYPVSYQYAVMNSRYARGYHTGEDYAASQGTRVQATSPGTVLFVGWGGNYGGWGGAYGTMVVVEQLSNFRRTGRPLRYAYCHLHTVNVRVGEKVVPGKKIGTVGSSGNATGSHLHFEVRRSPWGYGDDVHPVNAKRRRR